MGCAPQPRKSELPNGYKIYVMNAEEVYLGDSSGNLIVGPGLTRVGVTQRYLITFSEKPKTNYLNRAEFAGGFGIVDMSSGTVTAPTTESRVRGVLQRDRLKMPEMRGLDDYSIVTQ